MVLGFLSLLIFIAGIIAIYYGIQLSTKAKKEIDRKESEQKLCESKLRELESRKNVLRIEIGSLAKKQAEAKLEHLKTVDESKEALRQYENVLEQNYTKVEKQYQEKIDSIKKEKGKVQDELDQMKSTQAALIEARKREKQIQEEKEFYTLPLSAEDAVDIQMLEKVKKKLSKPRILSMLIWSTYFQKPLKALCANILGKTTVTGIYKITNIETGECYIGQAVDMAKRWTEHAKCGLGIDTPQGNKLYKAMMEWGVTSFSWELLEECSPSLLNEKEQYYIGLYDSINNGYNSIKAPRRK